MRGLEGGRSLPSIYAEKNRAPDRTHLLALPCHPHRAAVFDAVGLQQRTYTLGWPMGSEWRRCDMRTNRVFWLAAVLLLATFGCAKENTPSHHIDDMSIPKGGPIRSLGPVAFSPDGKCLAMGYEIS